ncbi:MAG: ATP-binding protein, partial [Clostridia bacterium]
MMQLRYDAGYRITVDVAEDLLLLPLPRMSLEPIVENAVQHGFVRGGTQHFFVHIHAAFDKGMLRVLISDNGCGIAPERLAEIGRELSGDAFERVENSDHIGLN